jgi:calcium-dependent protein kinase
MNSGGSVKDNYQIGKRLGGGGFGEVRYCRHKKTKEKRAVKFIQKSKLLDSDSFFNEVSVLSSLDHPNIIKLFEFYEEK